MKMNKIVLLISLCSIVSIKAQQGLEQMIVKTNIEAVKEILPTITLTLEAKSNLVSLASDIILMRLKVMEIYSYKPIINDDDLEGTLKEFLSIQVQEKIKETKTITKPFLLAGAAFLLCCSSLGALISYLEDDPAKVVAGVVVGVYGGLTISFFGWLETAIIKTQRITRMVHEDLQKNYTDAILIKQLIANAPLAG